MSANGHSRERVCIESIRIGRAPGIEGAFALTNLGPGITVIHGPNGSGKSTTARSIHSLLWPDPVNDTCLVEATLSYAGSRWTIRRDGRSVRCQRDGQDHAPLTFAHLTPDTRDRYHLALHDLLRADDAEFAEHVTREASGGFDLEAAASALKFNTAPADPRNLAKTHKEAQRTYQEAVDRQSVLKQEEAELAALNVESERAKQAGINILKLNAIGEALDARAELQDAIAACYRFDTGMAHVTSSDAGTLAEWRKQEPLLRQTLADLERTIGRERERMARTGLPLDKDCTRDTRMLAAQLDELRQVEEARRQAATSLEAARQQLIDLRDQIAPHLPESLRTEAALAILRTYGEALNRSEEAARIGDAEQRLAAWIPKPSGKIDPDRLRDALNLLAGWLRTPPPPAASPAAGRARLAALVATILVVAQGVLLGLTWNPVGYGLAAAGIVIGLIVLLTSSVPTPVDARLRFEDDFLRLGLPAPAEWTPEAVAVHFDQTKDANLREQSAAQDAERWRALTPILEQRYQAMADAKEQQEALESRLGVEVRFDRPALATMTTALDGWLKASQDVDRLEWKQSQLLELERDGLAAFNMTTTDLGGAPAANGHEAKAVLGQLQDRLDEMKQASRAIEQATTERETQVIPTLERIIKGRVAMINRYGGGRSLTEIEALAGQHAAYEQALHLVRGRRDHVNSRCARLETGVQISEWTPERVRIEIAAERAIEQQSADVNQRIGAINQSIAAAKSRNEVEDALADVEKTRNALRERRDDHLLQTVGGLLLEAVRRETREANLPAVAHRARELFAEITHGRYRLNFNPGPPASFTATDNTTSSEHTLNELSSGTRVQLLIAVRTAFVDQNEHDACLPMIFDETLANADAARAEVLIETTFKLCERGRQVLYFTAQFDEVDKWRHLAEQHETEIQVIDLAKVRRLDALTRPALADLKPIAQPVFPAPIGHSRLDYRQVLGVPPLSPWSADGGDIHLWYLTDDLDELHRLVTARNVSRWGQVRQLTTNGESPALGLDRERIEQMTIRADTCFALIEAARIGRGRRVTRQDLIDSNGMSDRFADRCLELLETCDGDGQRFLDCLENREITGFRTDNIDKFREHFEANGHTVAESTLTPEEIRIVVARRMNDAIAAGLSDLSLIDQLMHEAFLPTDAVNDAFNTEAAVLSAVN